MPGFNTPFPSAFTRPGVTPAEVLAFHRSHWGDARMSNDDGALGGGDDGGDAGNGGQGDGGNAGTGSSGQGQSGQGGDAGTDRGFPENTPLTEMTVEQREAYWKYQARKHEARANSRADYDDVRAERDRLKQASETENERAVREAREQGAQEARTQAANETVAAMLRMGLRARGIDGDTLNEVVATINLGAHASDKGEVDDEMVLRTINRLAGTAGSSAGPDTGQGNRGGQSGKSGVAAGAELYAASRGKKTTS